MSLQTCWESATVTTGGAEDVATMKAFECIFQGIINVALRFGGVVLFIMIIAGGFTYLTAGGDPKKAQMGRNVITYAIVGLVLLILAWFILLFIQEFTQVNVTVFEIPTGD